MLTERDRLREHQLTCGTEEAEATLISIILPE